MKILVVEDDSDCVKLIREALGSLCSVLKHTDKLKEALQMIMAGYDAIWLDLSLADSVSDDTVDKGIPALRALAPAATMIVVSGYGETMRNRAIKAGADAYACKTELNGFDQSSIAALLIQAAVHAMQRGADAGIILERVTKFFSSLCLSLKPEEP